MVVLVVTVNESPAHAMYIDLYGLLMLGENPKGRLLCF